MKQLDWMKSVLAERHDWYESVLLVCFRLCAGLSLLVPLLYSTQLMYGVSTAKHFFFRTIVSLMALLYALLASHNRKYAPRPSLITFSLLGIFLAYTISSAVAGTAISSFWGNYLRMDGLLGWGYLLVYYLTLTHVLVDSDWWQALVVAITIGYWVSLVAVSQYLGASIILVSTGGVRSTATFGNAAYYGWYQMMVVFLVLLLWVQKQRKLYAVYALSFFLADSIILGYVAWSRFISHQANDFDYLFRNIYLLALTVWVQWLAWRYWRSRREVYRSVLLASLIIVGCLGMYASQSKAAVVATVLGFLTIAVAYVIQRFQISRRIVCWSVIAVVLALSLSWLATGRAWPQPIRWLENSKSFHDRALVWGAAGQAFWAKPLLGWGMDNFPVAFDRYYPSDLYDSASAPIWYDKAHSIYGQYAVEGGLLVLLGYLILLYALVRAVRRWTTGSRAMKYVLIGFGLAYLCIGLVYFDTIANAPLLFLLLALIRQQSRPERSPMLQSPLELFIPRAATGVLIVLGSLLFWYNFTARQLITNLSYMREVAAVQAAIESASAVSLDALHSVVTNSPTLGKTDLRSQFGTVMGDLMTAKPDDPEVRRYVPIAMTDLQKNSGKRTNLLLPVVEIANYSIIAGRLDPQYWSYGREVVDRLLAVAPNRLQFYYLAGRLRILHGDTSEGLAYFQRAIDQKPMFDTYFNYYKQMVTLVPEQESEAFLRNHLQAYSLGERFQIINFDLSLNQPQRALTHLMAMASAVSQDSTNQVQQVAHWQRLAAIAYSQLGENQKALTAARQSYRLDPITNGDLPHYFPQLDQ